MTVRPILFSSPMLKALLASTKTQTRRALNPQPIMVTTEAGDLWASYAAGTKTPLVTTAYAGDLLYVREAWSGPYAMTGIPPRDWRPTDVWFWADGNPTDGDWTKPKPGIHMPRWASRLTLEVTNVRVERLQAISHDDAVAEGLIKLKATGRYVIAQGDQYLGGADHDPRVVYSFLWDAINGAGAWAADPWVAAYKFTVHRQNVDALLADRASSAA